MSAVPFSYRQYAGNGSTTTFSVPFPYLLKSHVKVYIGFNILDGTYSSELADGTGFTWSSGTQIQCTTAPASGQTLTVIRVTPNTTRLVDWQDGSNLISNDLDTADLQNLYVIQEQQDRNDAGITQSTNAQTAAAAATAASTTATTTANAASTAAATATTTANAASASAATALSQSNTAIANSASALTASANAVTTANTAATNAASAVTTAGTANTNATAAVNTANTAASNASTALSQSSTALSNSATALSTANTAASNASTALTNSSNAVTTANTASTNASNAVTTANTASTNATAALNAVASSLQYVLVANVAAIPSSPANNYAIEVADSTGVESFSPLANRPAGFVGDVGLSVRMQYSTTGPTWNWLNYFPNNAETRYLKLAGGTLTGQLRADDSTSVAAPVIAFDGDTNTGLAHTGADELALVTGGTARLTVDPSGAVAVTNALSVGGQAAVVTNDARLSDTRTPTDGSVTNAKVSASAAIAGSKISPDFGAQNVTTTGTSTAASFIPTSSTVPTNGLYLPSAGSVAISTGGSGRLFVDASGKIGIGGTPNYNLDLYAGSANFQGANQGIYWDSATNKCAILADSGALKFATGTSSVVERLRITSAGLVGVGSSSPWSKLSIGSGGTATPAADVTIHDSSVDAWRLKLTSDNFTANTKWLGLGFGYHSGALKAGILAEATDAFARPKLHFCLNNSTNSDSASLADARLTITPAGLVGIGTSSPSSKLYVSETNTTSPSLTYGAASSFTFLGANVELAGGLSGTTPFPYWLQTRDSTNAARALTINPLGGNVGIGTTSPRSTLTVAGQYSIDNNTTDPNDGAAYLFQQGGVGWNLASTNIAFSTGGSGSRSERARIDSSGRLLVGTSTSASGGSSTYARLQVSGNSAGLAGVIAVGANIASTAVSANQGVGYLMFTDNGAGQYAWIGAENDGTSSSSSDVPGRLIFATTADGSGTPTERLRITSNGYSKFSTNGTYSGADAHNFYQSNTNNFGLIVGGFGAYTSTVLAAQGTNASATAFNLFEGYYGGNQTTGVGAAIAIRIRGDGNVTNLNNSYGSLSDIKLKENIVDATSQWDDLKALQVRKYNFKEGQTHTQIGLVAQEVELVSPGLVTESPDRDAEGNDLGTTTKSVNYSVLYMKAVKALQEAMERIETLEAKVAALEAQ